MIVGANSLGTNLNRMLDSLGYPDIVGDLRGAQVDLMTRVIWQIKFFRSRSWLDNRR